MRRFLNLILQMRMSGLFSLQQRKIRGIAKILLIWEKNLYIGWFSVMYFWIIIK